MLRYNAATMADHRFPGQLAGPVTSVMLPSVWNSDRIISYHDLTKKAAPVLSIVARITRHALRHMVAVPKGSALSLRGLRRQQASVGGGSGGGAGAGLSFFCAIPNS
jgi:hypothetical protein